MNTTGAWIVLLQITNFVAILYEINANYSPDLDNFLPEKIGKKYFSIPQNTDRKYRLAFL